MTVEIKCNILKTNNVMLMLINSLLIHYIL